MVSGINWLFLVKWRRDKQNELVDEVIKSENGILLLKGKFDDLCGKMGETG